MDKVAAIYFWKHLCDDLYYRFFSGVPCRSLKFLYETINSNVMYYVPAVNERVAVGISSGVAISGDRCGILFHIDYIFDILKLLEFNYDYKVPILLIGGCDGDFDHKQINYIDYITFNLDTFKSDLNKLMAKTILKDIPGLVLIKGD